VHQADDRFLFRPGQILVHADDHQHVAAHLEQYGAREHGEHTARLQRHDIPIHVYRLGEAHQRNVPRIVQETRGLLGTRQLRVSPNHVFTGAPGYTPGGAGVPKPAQATTEAFVTPTGEPLVAILDTGLPTELPDWHKSLAAAVVPATDDATDVLDADGDDFLDLEAGHGTFVAAVLRAHAPNVRFTVERVLTPGGIGDEVEIADAIRRTSAPILNLSFGGYTHDDQPPLAIADAIAGMGDGRLAIASAGNGGSERETWPAALDGVVGVGALTQDDNPTRADFSNFGPWVSACAPATAIQAAYVYGRYPAEDGTEDFTGWAEWRGTSFAAPQVAAAVANRMVADNCTAREAWEALCAEPDRVWVDHLGVAFL
jgi:hypothetical protein